MTEFKHVLELGKMGKFRSGKKSEKSPYEKFHEWVAKKVNGKVPEGYLINVSASFLHPADEKELWKLSIQYAQAKMPHLTKRAAVAAVSWLNLDIGPASFGKKAPKGIVRGKVYVKEYLFRKKEND